MVLLDWGLAKVWHPDGSSDPELKGSVVEINDITITNMGKAQGTAHYMSPEQIKQDPGINHRTDIFSLGAIIYEVLCGKTPANGEQLYEIIESVQNDTPVNPSERTKLKVPQLLEKVAMRSLSKDPQQRYQTMNEVIRLLQQDWRSDLKR